MGEFLKNTLKEVICIPMYIVGLFYLPKMLYYLLLCAPLNNDENSLSNFQYFVIEIGISYSSPK